jgi:hypothetical protein
MGVSVSVLVFATGDLDLDQGVCKDDTRQSPIRVAYRLSFVSSAQPTYLTELAINAATN